MPPATGPALIILVAFVLPGFVTVLLEELTFKTAGDPTPLDRLLRIIVNSVWSYLLIAVVAVIVGVNKRKFLHWYHVHTGDPAQLVCLAAALVLVESILIATAMFLWSRSGIRTEAMKVCGLNPNHLEPTAWDFFFRKGREAYVRVKFATGEQVVGYYGSKSFAAYSKDGRDLYLEDAHAWNPETELPGAEVDATCGVWVNTTYAVQVEFYNGGDGETASQVQDLDPGHFEEERPPGSEATSQAAAASAVEEVDKRQIAVSEEPTRDEPLREGHPPPPDRQKPPPPPASPPPPPPERGHRPPPDSKPPPPRPPRDNS